MNAAAPAAQLRLLVRTDCGLCDEFLADYRALAKELALPDLELTDVDSDPVLARRWGLKIPVLLLDDTPVCHARLDAPELRRLLRL